MNKTLQENIDFYLKECDKINKHLNQALKETDIEEKNKQIILSQGILLRNKKSIKELIKILC